MSRILHSHRDRLRIHTLKEAFIFTRSLDNRKTEPRVAPQFRYSILHTTRRAAQDISNHLTTSHLQNLLTPVLVASTMLWPQYLAGINNQGRKDLFELIVSEGGKLHAV